MGTSGVVVNLGLFAVLLRLGLSKYVASPLAIECSIISNFLLNNYWTFQAQNSSDPLLLKGLKFKGVSLLSLCVSYTTFIGLSFLFPHVPPVIHQAIAIPPATLVNYFLNAYWTFKDRSAD